MIYTLKDIYLVFAIQGLINYAKEQKHDLDDKCFSIITAGITEWYSINQLNQLLNN